MGNGRKEIFEPMVKIHDFSECPLSDRAGTYGGAAGLKDGIIYNDEYWIIKYPKSTKSMNAVEMSYTTTPLSEYLGSHVYKILGYDVHETLLGIRNKKLVVACKDFCKREGSLREIRTIKNLANPELAEKLERSFSSTGDTMYVDLEELLLHIQYNDILSRIPDMEERFWDSVVIDALINNNDRNNGNWGVLYEEGKYKLAPVYDNGASFSNKADEGKIKRMLSNPQLLEESSTNTITSYGLQGKQLTVRAIMNLDYPGLKAALLKNVPLIKDKMPQLHELFQSVPESWIGIPVCSKDRADLYFKTMECRLQNILIPSYQKVLFQDLDVNFSAHRRKKLDPQNEIPKL